MGEINLNEIVGDSFEDMTISEMAYVQGAGDHANPENFSLVFTIKMSTKVVSQAACGGAVTGAIISYIGC